MSATFEINDLIRQIGTCYHSLTLSNLSSDHIECFLLSCADQMDQLYPQIERESVIETKYRNLVIDHRVKQWSKQENKLKQLGMNGWIITDIASLHGDYSDWCMEQEIDPDQIIDWIELYKMLRSLGYKVHF